MEASEQPETQTVVDAPAPTPAEPPVVETAPEETPEPVGDVVDDGIHDIEPNRPVVGDWVDIIDGEYRGRLAAYIRDVGDGTIEVRTRDADNLTVDLPYASVRQSASHGGR